ncbi:MAG: CRISPR-associated helicase Cas3' [Chloroflexi bacterium]|nr:CRISPR-associated helicase Cas3' [Chloroflexota bacterium]
MTYYAHSNAEGKENWQLLIAHLTGTAALAVEFGRDAGISDFAYVAALLHDIGKYSQAFQKRLEGAPAKVDHSTAGAREIIDLFSQDQAQQFIATLLAYCISGHHGGLLDFGSPIDLENDGTLQARLKRQLQDYSVYAQEIETVALNLPATLPIRPNRRFPGFSLAFFTRMVYSTLVDADFQETETFMQGKKPRGGYADIAELCNRFNRFLERFDRPQTPIDVQRTQTLKACIEKAGQRPGYFSLTVPTGGGKTFTSMAFALNHAIANGMKRIIYVIPYTSIIEQNAAEFKKCLGSDHVLEHHSNFDWSPRGDPNQASTADNWTNNALQKLKLAAENWDIPIVVTTNVQFFESLFANRSSHCRKLHNLARSVIIFDEAQMLPREYLQPCLYAVSELVNNYRATAVFCTATQPRLERFLPEDQPVQELVPNPNKLYDFYKRVKVVHLGKRDDESILRELKTHLQVLCIVNTRKHAKGLFAGLENAAGRFHLSTLMCPAHRKNVLASIRQRLEQGQPCRVISTQIMEAGIDVDFPVGYRAMAGLDSIIQAAGRVNREGKQAVGEMFVFEPDSMFVKRTPAYIQQGADLARSILREYDDPVCLEAIRSYFEQLYDFQGKHAFDAHHILEYFDKGALEPNFDFKTAAENFKLIQNHTIAVVIPYQDGESALRELSHSQYPMSYSRKLQAYTVNIYEQEFQALQGKGLVDIYADVYSVLNDMNYYDAETGLILPENSGGDAIFFDG